MEFKKKLLSTFLDQYLFIFIGIVLFYALVISNYPSSSNFPFQYPTIIDGFISFAIFISVYHDYRIDYTSIGLFPLFWRYY